MIADTSVWIDASAGRRTWQVERLRKAIDERKAMIVDLVRFEVLASISPSRSTTRVTAMLDGCEDVMQVPRKDAEEGAHIFRSCRGLGEPIRSSIDCVIAAIAIRNDLPVLHAGGDFDMIARHFPLRVETE